MIYGGSINDAIHSKRIMLYSDFYVPSFPFPPNGNTQIPTDTFEQQQQPLRIPCGFDNMNLRQIWSD